jgi:protein O-mannosyl-transferase
MIRILTGKVAMLSNNHKRQELFVYIILIVTAFAVFRQVHQFDFTNFDDQVYVTENSHIQSGITLNGIRWAFSTTYAEFWHPLTWLSLMADYQIHGLNPGGYHLTNLILHILSTLLLFWLFHRMTGAVWKSAFVAAFFALHPLHVESVAWIAERKDVLSAFFWMLTLCLYVYYTEKPVIQRYWLVMFSFVCALMSKPMVVTLPVIMILLDYWPLNRFESNKDNLILWQVKEKLPFFVLSAVFSSITIYAQYNPFLKYSFDSRLANSSISFIIYLEKTFWPFDLAVFYPFVNQLPIWQILVSALLIIVISSTVIAMAKRFPYLFVGWLWYAIAILPVIGILQIGAFAMADRYTYLSLIGIGIMLGWGMPSLIKRENLYKKILLPAAIAFLAVMSLLTWEQCTYWKNSYILWNHALKVTSNNYLAHNNIASYLKNKGEIKEAFYHYNQAIRISPSFNDALYNRGVIYTENGFYNLAIEDYNKAIKNNHNMTNAYFNRGIIYGKLRQYGLALKDFNKAIVLKENYAEAYNNRGFTYFNIGQYQQAIEDYKKAIILKPDYTEAYINCGLTYLKLGNKNMGCLDFHKACELGNCNILTQAQNKGYCR